MRQHHVFFSGALVCLALSSFGSTQVVKPSNALVRLIPNSDPSFKAALLTTFPDLANNQDLPRILPLLSMIRNETGRQVKTVVLKYRITYSNGVTTTSFRRFYPAMETAQVMPGAGVLLMPKESIISSPAAYLTEQSTAEGTLNFEKRVSAANEIKADAQITRVTSITATIDSVIFAGGVVVGRDERQTGSLFACQRNAMIAETGSLVPLTTNTAGLIAQLKVDAVVSDTSVAATSCSLAKAWAAQKLLRLSTSMQPSALTSSIRQTAQGRLITMTKYVPQETK